MFNHPCLRFIGRPFSMGHPESLYGHDGASCSNLDPKGTITLPWSQSEAGDNQGTHQHPEGYGCSPR